MSVLCFSLQVALMTDTLIFFLTKSLLIYLRVRFTLWHTLLVFMCHSFTFLAPVLWASLPYRCTVQRTTTSARALRYFDKRTTNRNHIEPKRLNSETAFNSKTSDLQCCLCTIVLYPDKVTEWSVKLTLRANVYFHSDYISIHSRMESLFQCIKRKPQLACIKRVKNSISSEQNCNFGF